MSDPVITRFAPSPTGFLHIGGARTALFNWLYARSKGGQMRLRIEDTDRARCNARAIDAIYDGLAWLGLDWDGEPVSQFARRERHCQVVQQLLDGGQAYRCYARADELAQMREAARAQGLPPRYDGRWRERDPADAPANVPAAIRFKAPQSGMTVIADRIQGRVVFPNKDLDDLVLLRSDGTPTYMLAVVVDDHDMNISHIIRGDDHLTNAARQTQIYQALGWAVPEMAHVPLIHGSDGAKLSKRHGALGVEAYRAMGYLPEAMRDYLVRLGWAHGDDEIFSREQLLQWFDLDAIGKSPARFDIAKLEHINGVKLRAMDDAALMGVLANTLGHLEGGEALSAALREDRREKIVTILPAIKARARTLHDVIAGFAFMMARRPLTIEAAAQKHLGEEGKGVLSELRALLADVDPWNAGNIEATVRAFGESRALKLGRIAQPLRAALTGKATSIGIFDVLEVLGQEEALGRVDDTL